MNRRDLNLLLIAGSIAPTSWLMAAPASAQGGAPTEGRDYTRLEPPQPVQKPGKVEVLEFFSYACPHCSAFEPSLEAWAKRLPADVTFRRVPVPFLMNAENFMRTYYALETTGEVNAMQMKIFRGIHVERLHLEKGEEIAAFVGKNGGNAQKFLEAFKSFSVATSVARAKKMMADYKIESVPTLIVQGRYVTSPSIAGSPERALAAVDSLIQRARKG